MAKVSSIQKNLKRIKLSNSQFGKRAKIKKSIYDKTLPLDQRFALVVKLSSMKRNAAKVRVRNRCELTGRPRGYYSKFKLSRNMLRELAGFGEIPGLIKSSW